MHNDTVDKMTDGTGKVADMTYAELMELKVDSGNNIENYPNLKLATLEEYLDVCKEYGLHPIIEIKDNADPDTVHEVAEILLAREEKDMFYIICFGREICLKMKTLAPEIPVYYLISMKTFRRRISISPSTTIWTAWISTYTCPMIMCGRW